MALILLAIALAAAGPDSQSGAAPEKAKRICRESENQTGSHIRTGRRCRTAEEWARDDAARDRKPADLRVTEGQDYGQPRPQ